jgi:hypothetical protein
MAAKKHSIVPTITLEGRDKKGDRVVYPAGQPVEFLANEAKYLIDKKQAVAASDLEVSAQASVPVAEPDPTIATVDQISAVLNDVAEDDFTADGRPKVEALEKLTGLEVTAKRRDAAWEKLVADQKGSDKQP